MLNNFSRFHFNKHNSDSDMQNDSNDKSCFLGRHRYVLAFIIVTDAWILLNIILLVNGTLMSGSGNALDYFYPFSSSPESGLWAYDFTEFLSYGITIPSIALFVFKTYSLTASLTKQSTVVSLALILYSIMAFGLVSPIEDMALQTLFMKILRIVALIIFIIIVADMVYFRSRGDD